VEEPIAIESDVMAFPTLEKMKSMSPSVAPEVNGVKLNLQAPMDTKSTHQLEVRSCSEELPHETKVNPQVRGGGGHCPKPKRLLA
jgi:hypothetical protein